MIHCKIKFNPRKVKADTDIVTEPEQVSKELLDALDKTDQSLQSLYVEMAESDQQEEYSEEVSARLRSYWRTSENLVRASQRNAAAIILPRGSIFTRY